MKQSCHETLVVHMHIGEYGGYRQRVGYVGFAGFPYLPIVGVFRKQISFSDLLYLVMVVDSDSARM